MGLLALAEGQRFREAQIRDHLGRVESQTPGGQQLGQRGAGGGHHARERIVRLLVTVEETRRVEEGQQLAAAQHELVEGELRLVGNVFRMRHDEHLDVVVDLVRLHLDLPHVVVALEFLDEDPRALTLPRLAHAHHHRIRGLAEHRERRHHAQHGFVRADDESEGVGDVVFQQSLPIRGQPHRHFFRVQADGQPEVEVLPERSHLLRFHAVGLRRFLGIAVRSGIDLAHLDLAVGGETEFFEQVFHVIRVGADVRRHACLALREVEAHLDRRI